MADSASRESVGYSHHKTLTGIGYFLDGYNLNSVAVFTFLLIQYKFFSYDAVQLGFVTGISLLGAVAGAVLVGRISDLLGRRRTYFLYPILFIIFPFASALSWNISVLIIFRFFLGIGIGADYAVGPVYSIEQMQESSRGKGYGYIWAFWSLGAAVSFFTGLIALHYVGTESWRIALGISSIPATLLIFMRVGVPESEKWTSTDISKNHSSIDNEPVLRQAESVGNENQLGVSKLFRGNLGYRTVVVWTQWILLDIGSYGFNLYTPIIVSQIGYGIYSSLVITGILYTFGFLAAIISIGWNDRYGRKIIQEMGFFFMAVGMSMILISSELRGQFALPISFAGLILWFASENIGPGNTMGLYAMELFPTRLRSTSMGAATAITRLVSFLSAFEFPLLLIIVGKEAFFTLMIAVMCAAFLFTVVFTPETRGLTLDQVVNYKLKKGKLVP